MKKRDNKGNDDKVSPQTLTARDKSADKNFWRVTSLTKYFHPKIVTRNYFPSENLVNYQKKGGREEVTVINSSGNYKTVLIFFFTEVTIFFLISKDNLPIPLKCKIGRLDFPHFLFAILHCQARRRDSDASLKAFNLKHL